jgi:hypothetical protein
MRKLIETIQHWEIAANSIHRVALSLVEISVSRRAVDRRLRALLPSYVCLLAREVLCSAANAHTS